MSLHTIWFCLLAPPPSPTSDKWSSGFEVQQTIIEKGNKNEMTCNVSTRIASDLLTNMNNSEPLTLAKYFTFSETLRDIL